MAIDIEAPGANEAALKAALRSLTGTNFSGALVKKAADQTGANYSAGAIVAWDAEVFDEGGWHDNATNNSRLTVPAGLFGGGTGYVHLDAAFYCSNYAGSGGNIRFYKNGTVIDPTPIGPGAQSGTAISGVATRTVSAAERDYFEAFLFINGDTSVSVVAAFSFFSARKL